MKNYAVPFLSRVSARSAQKQLRWEWLFNAISVMGLSRFESESKDSSQMGQEHHSDSNNRLLPASLAAGTKISTRIGVTLVARRPSHSANCWCDGLSTCWCFNDLPQSTSIHGWKLYALCECGLHDSCCFAVCNSCQRVTATDFAKLFREKIVALQCEYFLPNAFFTLYITCWVYLFRFHIP